LISSNDFAALSFIPIGYCIYDTLIYYGKSELYIKGDSFTPLHHAIFALLSYFYIEKYSQEVAIGYLAELSNPALHACYIILYFKKDSQSILFKILSIWILISFFIFRLCGMTYLCFRAYYSEGVHEFIVLLILLNMNVMWFDKLINKAREQKVI
jgi:hypothetical protein